MSEEARNEAAEKRVRWGMSSDNLKSIVYALLLGLGVRVGVAHAYEIEGPSMEPNIIEGDRIWVARFAYGLSIPFVTHAVLRWSEPEIGDVVVAQSPFDEQDVVKRVLGVPGDVIEVREGEIVRNGERLRARTLGPCDASAQIEPDGDCTWYEERLGDHVYRISQSSYYQPTVQRFTVPEGHVFLVGDHRDRSNDSRAFGPVEISRVRGFAVGID